MWLKWPGLCKVLDTFIKSLGETAVFSTQDAIEYASATNQQAVIE